MRVAPAAGLPRPLSQPGGPHVSGLPREESTDMRAPPQLDFGALLNQLRGPPHVSGSPREEAPT